jgi:catechol 2,3-dioxygenase-like lactoylglutathione lyase family enzyme
MAITRIQLFSLAVTNQARSIDFYVHQLGFELVADTEMGPGQRWVQVKPRGSATSITLVTWFPTMPAGSTKGTVIETDDLEGEIATLKN